MSSEQQRKSTGSKSLNERLTERHSTGHSRQQGVLGTSGSTSPLSKLQQGSTSGRLFRSSVQAKEALSGLSGGSKPTRTSAPGDFKKQLSQSLSSGSTAVYQALRSVTPAGATTLADRTSPADRKSATAGFRPTQSLTISGSLSSPSGRQKASTPAESQMVLDDIVFTYGHSSFQGQRDYQEDTVSVLSTPASFLGGVFDGHGGDDVSKELERVLLQNINVKVAEAQARYPDDVRAIENAIRAAYMTTNEEIATRVDKASDAGSCAVTALVRRVGGRPYLFCANAGDCRAVLYTHAANGAKRALRLSEDHKPHPNVCPSEITRICDAGGCVLWGRVQGCLAVSRAFGDRTLQPFVIADPHIEARQLDPDKDMFIYLASDGVTDMVDDMQGCTLIAEQLARGCTTQQAAAALVSAAFHKGSCDNISVLVLRIRPRGPI